MKLTVGKQISMGFGVLITILLCMGLFSFYVSLSTEKDFGSYRSTALDTNFAGRIQANLLMMRIGVIGFFNSGEQKHVDLFTERRKKVDEFMSIAHNSISNAERPQLHLKRFQEW